MSNGDDTKNLEHLLRVLKCPLGRQQKPWHRCRFF